MATRFGAPDVLELVDLPTPEPAAGQLRVAVTVVGVGWLDALIRRGHGPEVFGMRPPYVPGSGVAGTVVSLGSGVAADWLGARVLTRPVGGGYGGGYADTVIAAPDGTFPVPDDLDLRTALALFDDGSTALALLEKTPVHAGDRVLVAPGLGGLGNLLVQLLKTAGASVIAAVRGADKVATARDLGVEAVDYSAPDWPGQVFALTEGLRLDVVFDGIGGTVGAAALGLVADGGRFSGYGMSSGTETSIDATERQRLTVVDMAQLQEFWAETPRRVREVLRIASAGELVPLIGRTYPLAEAVTAHADIEARRFVGKSLLLP